VRTLDVDDVRVHVPVRQACSLCVFVLAALLEDWNQDVCLSVVWFVTPLAGFSQCRFCAVLLCSILCWYWDCIPRACQAL